MFTLRGSGNGPAVMTDPLDANPNTRINSGLRAAHAGERWDMWATGMGPIPTSDAERAPFFDRTDWDVKVLVGGREARLEYRGRSGCCSGLDQVRFVVPEGVEGCCVPVQLVVNGVVSNTVSMSIGKAGRRLCETDLLADIPDELARFFDGEEEFRTGSIGLTQFRTFDAPDRGRTATTATVFFSAWRFVSTVFDPCLTVEPGVSGPCTVFRLTETIAFDLEGNELGRSGAAASASSIEARSSPPPLSREKLANAALAQIQAALPESYQQQPDLPFRFLDLGPAVSLVGPGGRWELPRSPDGPFSPGPVYSAEILAEMQFVDPAPDGLPRGEYTFQAPGGADLGGFSASISTAGLEWTNYRDAFPEIRRDQPFQVNWTGDSRAVDVVAVFGSSLPAAPSFDVSTFNCTAEFERGGLTLHPNMLREMHATDLAAGSQGGTLGVALGLGRIDTVAGVESVGIGYSEIVSVQAPYTGDGFSPPSLSFRVKKTPAYPPEARQAGIEGVVFATLLVAADGVPQILAIQGGGPLLGAAVREVVPEWRIDGAGLFTAVEVVVTFSLSDGVSCELKELRQ